jgi:anti-sigma factor RsiW
VQRGALLVQLRLGAFAARLVLGDPCTLLGLRGLLLTNLRLGAMLAGDLLAALLQLALALTQPAFSRIFGRATSSPMTISATMTMAMMAPVVI